MPAPALEPLLDWGRSLGLTGEPVEVRRQPWATTARVGDVWLKACGAGGRYEAGLLGGLLWWGAPHAVLPLAVDAALGFAALPHAGTWLHDVEPAAQDWARLLTEHAALQRRLERHVDDAVALGVPDLRPEHLPDALDALLSRAEVPARVRSALTDGRAAFELRCARLAAGPVAAVVQHDDLYDRNLVVDDQGAARAIDWGDSSVGHPFGVLLVSLRVLRHRGLPEPQVLRARDAYLSAWDDAGDRDRLLALADDAVHVQALARALSWERALQGADEDERATFDDPMTGWLEVLAGGTSAVRG